jgi:hypothetical protein
MARIKFQLKRVEESAVAKVQRADGSADGISDRSRLASARKRAISSGWKSSLRQSRMGLSLPFFTQLRTVCGLTHKAFASPTSVTSWGTRSDTICLSLDFV